MAPRKKVEETVETTEEKNLETPEAEPQAEDQTEEGMTEDPVITEDSSALGNESSEDVSEESFFKGSVQIEESTITETDADNFESEMMLGIEFARRSVTIPGRRRRNAAFRAEEEIIGDDNGELDTYEKLKRMEYEILSDSAKSQKPKVLYGRMIGTEVMEIGKVRTVMAVCSLLAANAADLKTDREIHSSIYKIKIPAPMFFFDYNGRYSRDEVFDDLKRNMDTRVGSIVEFVVYNVNMDDEDVLASRINAMQILSYDNYLGKRARIKPGSLVKGRVVYANRLGVTVDVLGADVFIGKQDLSWRYVPNILTEKEFKVGEAIAVRVTSIDTDSVEVYGRRYPYVKIKASVKDAKKNPNQLYFDKYIIGQKYLGTIAYHLNTGQYIVNLGEKGVNNEQPICICKAPSVQMGGTPFVGQDCSVAIISKNESNYQIVGAFTYMAPI